MYYIDKKIHPGYQRPRIIFGRGLFAKELFKNTLLDGEMVKCKDDTWTFLINDIVCYEGKYLCHITLPERLNIIYNLLETQHTPDETIDVCNFKVKCYFNMYKESIEGLYELSKKLNYTCRGIYIYPYDLKYKPKLYNFDETNVIDVVRKTKDITEFKEMNNNTGKPCEAEADTASIASNASNGSEDITHTHTQAPSKTNINCSESQRYLYFTKTNDPDIYNIYENENIKEKSIGIALVQTLKDSKMLREAFRDKNAMTIIKFVCSYNEKFKKWHAISKATAPASTS
jgi:hypothetical protein